jgi:pilus assembly protein FimV
MRALARWGALPLLATPFGAWALGLGDIELRSSLNQPFNADITLVSATAEELAGLRVSLAPLETFQRYGLERPAFLASLDFTVARDERGRDVIRVSSRQSITEPFVTLLIEANWARGRLLREYTVLLDPPVLLPSPARPAQVQPAESFAPQPAAAGIDRPQTPPPAAAPPPAPASQAAAPAPAPASAGGTYGPVQRAETLWSIAARLQPQGMTMNQMLVALYEANPQAFDGNMNLLRAGAVLTIPDADTIRSRSVAAANQQFQSHLAAWQGAAEQQARLRLVAPGEAVAPAPAAAATATGAGGAASSAELARLEDELARARAELDESRRMLQIQNEEMLALQQQLSAASGAVQAAEQVASETPALAEAARPASAPGVDLESEPLFADELESGVAAAEPVVEAPAAEPEAPAPVAETRPITTPAVTTAPAPSLLDRVLGLLAAPLLWIGLGVVALLGAAMWFLRSRRAEEFEDVTGRWDALEAEVDEDIDADSTATTERLRRQVHDENFVVEEQAPRRDTRKAPSMSAPAAGAAGTASAAVAGAAAAAAAERTAPDGEDTLSRQTVINLDQTDVIAEADFHLAYGLYDQAAELVSKAVEQAPGRRDLKLKLLEVFFVWGNRDAFLDAASALREDLGDGPDPDWDKVVIMGKQICPDDPLFAQATAAAGELDMSLDAGDGAALDFAFGDQDSGEAEQGGVDLDFGTVTGTDLEFALDDVDDVDESAPKAQGASTTRKDRPLDWEDSSLDIGVMTAAGLEAAIADLDDDTGRRTTPDIDIDTLAATQESPTVESRSASVFDDDGDATEETPGPDARTMETPTIEAAGPWGVDEVGDEVGDEDATELAWFDDHRQAEGTSELPTIEQPGLKADSTDYTAEIDLDALGLDIDDLQNLPDGLGDAAQAADDEGGTREQPKPGDRDALLSATGVTQVLGPDEDLGQQQTSVLDGGDVAELDDDLLTGTEVLPGRMEEDEQTGSTSLIKALNFDLGNGDTGLDLDLEDLSSALDGAETVEQPRVREFQAEIFGGNGGTPIEFDVGSDDLLASDDPTGTEEGGSFDAQTMTEVGTKLDLARAYIDMGDPEGARSILEEVIDEGDTGQRSEAKGLIATLRG